MKTLKITTDNKLSIIDVNLDDYRALQQEIGGYIETVHTQIMYDYFKAPVLMLVDEEGLIRTFQPMQWHHISTVIRSMVMSLQVMQSSLFLLVRT